MGLAISAPAIAYTSMHMFDAILVTRSEADTTLWMGIEIALAALITIFTCLQQDTSRLLRDPLALEMTTQLARKAVTIPLTDLEAPGLREQLAQARETAGQRGGQFVGDLLVVIQGIMSLAICCAILAPFTWLAVLVFAATIPGALVEVWSARVMHRSSVNLTHDRQRFDQLEGTLLSGTSAIENKFLGVGSRIVSRLRAISIRLGGDQFRVWRRAGLAVAAAQLFPLAAYYGTYIYLGFEASRGALSFGALTLCLISMHNAQQFSLAALFASRNVGEYWMQLRSYFEVLDHAPPARVAGPPPVPSLGLRLENAGFRYPGSDAWAVRHVDLDIGRNEIIGIVGGNGSGKSTLVRLITGLYRPSEGRVMLDGRDLADWDEAALRARFAVVFQQFARYRMSLRDNLALPAAEGDEARCAAAFVASGVEQFVPGLPHGADTSLTPTFDSGVDLSGGQWQKVALARAFVRSDADILIMDEATSALDAPSEQRVLEHVCRPCRMQSVVLITHRLSALKWADKVVRLEKGRASIVPVPEAP
ncbi:MAG: ABC transporter ATP-binding protein/permease [Myxococcota bacterium]|nr:ABC transporter ATP-binding protein/permease [Myxococcota bacterium]